jgi:hypothetical protein
MVCKPFGYPAGKIKEKYSVYQAETKQRQAASKN